MRTDLLSPYFPGNLAAQLAEVQWLQTSYLSALPLLVLIPLLSFILKRERFWSSFLRFMVVALCLIALAGPYRRDSSESQKIAALIDVSKSVSTAAEESFLDEFLRFARRKAEDDRGVGKDGDKETEIMLYPFAGDVAERGVKVETGTSAKALAREVKSVSDKLPKDGTEIAHAFKKIVDTTDSAALLLMSDGMETGGNALDFVKRGGMQGMRIFPISPDPRLFSETKFEISTLYAPLTSNAEEKAEIRAALRNTTDREQEGRLELYVDNKKILSQNVSVLSKEERLITYLSPALEGGVHRIRAVLSPSQATEQNANLEVYRWISVKNKEKILLLSGTEDDEKVLARLLSIKGFAVESIIGDGSKQIPISLQDYSEVIFNNIAARQLPQAFLPNIKGYVQAGGGVLLLGGARSFGLGGYIDSPLEEISPLKFVPPQTKKKRLNVGVVLVVDKSRSMLTDGKIDAAKRSAYAAINTLKDEDQVAVIGFDTAPFTIIAMMPVPEAKNVADRKLRNLTASGQTNVLPALGLAQRSLNSAPVSRKHIILLTDGKFPSYEGDYQDVVAKLHQDGITLSAVAMGIEADAPLLKMMASIGKGAFYQTLDPSQLPQIFVQDIKVTTGEETMNEESEFPVLVGPGGMVSSSFTRFPPVEGFVETLPKKGSVLELITKKNEEPYPIMASWTVGEGKVIAYTSDANGRWSFPWLKWENFHRFWSELVGEAKRKVGAEETQVDFDLRYSVLGKALVFDLAVYDDKLQKESAPPVKARIEEPTKEIRTLTFNAEKKGRFRAVIDRARAGDYRLDIAYGNITFPTLAITVPEDSFGEVIGRGVNMQLLSELANFSGGVVNPEPRDLSFKATTREQITHLVSPVIISVLFLLILEAIVRELGLGGVFGALFGPGRRQHGNREKRRGIYGSALHTT